MKRNHILMAVGLIISAGLAIFGDKTPGDRVSEPVARPSSAPTPPSRTAAAKSEDKRKRPVTILALQPRAALIGRNGAPSGAELFARQSDAPPAALAADDVPAAPVEPSLPALPFTYLGKKYENAKWEVYLGIGDETYFVREGSVIDQKYAVNAIRPPTMTFTFIPLKQLQTLTIGEAN